MDDAENCDRSRNKETLMKGVIFASIMESFAQYTSAALPLPSIFSVNMISFFF